MDEMQMQQQMQAMGQAPEPPPQGGEQPQPPQPPQDNGDLEQLTKSTLDEMEKELAETESSLDAQYAQEFVKGMTQEEHELMASEPDKFLRLYEQRKAEDLKKKLEPKRQKVMAFRENLAKVENSKMRASVEQEFNAKHKDSSAVQVVEFFQNDLSKRQQAEFEKRWKQNNTPLIEQLEEVAQMMKKGNKQELPFDVSGEKYANASGEGAYESAFLKR